MLFASRRDISLVKIALQTARLYDTAGIEVRIDLTEDQLDAIAMQALSAMPAMAYGHADVVWAADTITLHGPDHRPLFTPPAI